VNTHSCAPKPTGCFCFREATGQKGATTGILLFFGGREQPLFVLLVIAEGSGAEEKFNACRGEGSEVGPLLAARALPLPGGGRAASTVLSSFCTAYTLLAIL
jgi:hypothetical protein